MQIGLALSGGGFRAAIFHVGVLARLAEEERLKDISMVSTVSGGSLAIGLVFALNDMQWPSSDRFINETLPQVQKILTTQGLRKGVISRLIDRILQRGLLDILVSRADDVSEVIQEEWGITKNLKDLPRSPRWVINATCHETGKNWQFERFRMGDYRFGYTYDTDFLIADALAASAAVPALIGPFRLDASGRQWFEYVEGSDETQSPEEIKKYKTKDKPPLYDAAYLWDGGITDNLGLEKLHDFEKGWPFSDFLLVSDASGSFLEKRFKPGLGAHWRLISGIMKNQIRSLQSRAVFEQINIHKQASGYLRTGNTCLGILEAAELSKSEREQLCEGSLSSKEVEKAARLSTDIDAVSNEDYWLLFQHGFEVADANLHGFHGADFKFIGYQNTQWARNP
ncbi:MAG: patatin-like phospholipase family protein [Chloroflexi bacterium]|nr:MAG: patatin-like phospholipase family protein [Chloroflexota bacterium]MBL1193863.1 patatin-like phospholipase family protein [Chloroflexota bacterium]NOH11157.1 patatin-like phospholipase family protein [Chloroflexota bacterium]